MLAWRARNVSRAAAGPQTPRRGKTLVKREVRSGADAPRSTDEPIQTAPISIHYPDSSM